MPKITSPTSRTEMVKAWKRAGEKKVTESDKEVRGDVSPGYVLLELSKII